jgi:hypothetical protein
LVIANYDCQSFVPTDAGVLRKILAKAVLYIVWQNNTFGRLFYLNFHFSKRARRKLSLDHPARVSLKHVTRGDYFFDPVFD